MTESEVNLEVVEPQLAEKLSELEILKQSLDDAKAKERSVYDQLLRMGAEFDNYRKRSEQRVQDSRKAGQEDMLLEVISLGDALIQAVSSSHQASDLESLKKGFSLVLTQYEKMLKAHGVEIIKAVGEKMNPNQHEALMQSESADVEDGVILDEIQRGYSFQGRVIRTAKVRVATNPKKESKEVS